MFEIINTSSLDLSGEGTCCGKGNNSSKDTIQPVTQVVGETNIWSINTAKWILLFYMLGPKIFAEISQDFTELFNCVDELEAQFIISGPLPTFIRGIKRFNRLLSLHTWLSKTCSRKRINYIDTFNLFWRCRHLFRAGDLHWSRSGVKVLMDHFWLHTAASAPQRQNIAAPMSACW